MFKTLFRKITGDPTKKLVGSLKPIVDEVASLEAELQAVSSEGLKLKTEALKERLAAGETLDDVLVEAFALVREASRRTTGLRHYDVQIMGGVLLHQGTVVEMRTGEGKTLVATLPLYLNALAGRGVHLVTVNDYLVRRDGGWMGKIFHALGLTVGCIGPLNFSALYDPEYVNPGAELEDERLVHWRPVTRQQAYQADITYGTSSEFGFDYLRDNMVTRPEDLVQRSLTFAIIDEVDNILIDEARTPLIISGPAAQSSQDYVRFAQYVRNLRPNTADEEQEPNGHYNVDEKSRTITLTEMGIAEIEKRIPEIDTEAGHSLYDPSFFHLTYYLDNALRAQYLYKRDHQYVVQNNQVIIVDDFTGRLMPGRRYSEGLHEAIEAKEGVQIQRETVTVATITLQNYFRLYEKLAGMTGTALTDAEEFDKIYELQVSPLPTNVEYIVETGAMGLREYRRKQENTDEVYYARPETADTPVFHRRTDFPDQVYGTAQAKDQAIIQEIQQVRESGRPILVGTTSVEHSETIHGLLQRERIPHTVLNAKVHQSEAWIVAQAGRKQAVTISTNMAGRGTDILLGGNPEGLAADMLEQELFDRPLLAQVAHKLLTEGLESAYALAEKHPQLSPALADALLAVKQQYDQALLEIQDAQVIGYLARTLQEPYQIDYNDLLNVLRLVAAGALRQARAYLSERDKDIALVEDAQRQFQNYGRYQQLHQDPRQTALFLTELVFDDHYNARAALIRAVMGGRRDEALRLTQTFPALPASLIERIEQIREQAERDRGEIRELGGLHVIGSERHESRRIDNQLRGRAARQGDPGSSRFFLSLEDDLMKRFGGERLKNFMTRTKVPEDMPIESSLLDRIIESSQERIEGYNFDIRKNVVEYDDVMNRQRQAIYEERRAILMGQALDLDEKIKQAFNNAIGELAQNYLDDYPGFMEREIGRAIGDFSTEATDTINLNGVLTRLRGWLPGLADLDRGQLAGLSAEQLTRRLMQLVQENQANGHNLYQLLQAMNRFIPLLPPVPNLAAILVSRRSGLLQVRENTRRQFSLQIEQFFNDFLAGQIEEAERTAIWQRAAERIQQAFTRFNVEGVAVKTFQTQQDDFRQEVSDALRDLLLDGLSAVTSEQLVTALGQTVQQARDNWRKHIGEEEYRNFQRLLLLDAMDKEWREYLTAMDDLRREISLEAIGQRDPKVEYKRRSYQMFADMRQNIERDVVNRFFQQIAVHQEYMRQLQAAALRTQASQSGLQVVPRQSGRGVEIRRDIPKVGRNDPCPCGSGKKYKNCHMRQEQPTVGGRNGQPGKQPVASKGKR